MRSVGSRPLGASSDEPEDLLLALQLAGDLGRDEGRIKGFSNLMGIFSIKVKPIKIFCTSKWNLFSIKMFREIPYMQIYMESKFSLHASK